MKPTLQLVTPQFVEEYFANESTTDLPNPFPHPGCDRVDRRIECLECHYPASESYYMLGPIGMATGPFGEIVVDPGCKYEQ